MAWLAVARMSGEAARCGYCKKLHCDLRRHPGVDHQAAGSCGAASDSGYYRCTAPKFHGCPHGVKDPVSGRWIEWPNEDAERPELRLLLAS